MVEPKRYMRTNTIMIARPYVPGEDITGFPILGIYAPDVPEANDYVAHIEGDEDNPQIIKGSLFDFMYRLMETDTHDSPTYCQMLGIGSEVICAKQFMKNGHG